MAPLPPPQQPGGLEHDGFSQQDSIHSEDSLLDDDDRGAMEFSDDEGLEPDKPSFTSLFRTSLIKSLLHKAKVSTCLAASDQPDH